VSARAVPRLLLVTPPAAVWGESFRTALEASLSGGVDGVLVRMPASTANEIFAFARAIQPVLASAGASFLIHDRVDVAMALGADGVHLARRSIPIDVARALLPRATLGFSAHSQEEIAAVATAGADYVTVSPVFPTASKPGAATLGAGRAADWSRAASLPTLWLGGVRAERVEMSGLSEDLRPQGLAAIEAFADAAHAEQEAARLHAWLGPAKSPG
jgi:thiamine-phosphate diphosphorylase